MLSQASREPGVELRRARAWGRAEGAEGLLLGCLTLQLRTGLSGPAAGAVLGGGDAYYAAGATLRTR